MLPHDRNIQFELLRLLAVAPGGEMHCQDAYRELESEFPGLTDIEVSLPYRRSASHWANRVQFARLHLLLTGHLLPSYLTRGGRGFWAISDAGRKWLAEAIRRGDELLSELGTTTDDSRD